MFIRIQGIVTDIKMMEGISKEGRPWSKKSYTIRDDFRNPDYNRSVVVDDLATLDKNSLTPVFIYHSNHTVDEKVDIACTIETNKYGFTNVHYFKSWDEFEKPKEEVVESQSAQAAAESNGDLPF